MIHIQKTAPGPPRAIAAATPMIFPVPTVAACAVIKATIVNDYLFAVEVCMSEWWCDVDNSLVVIAVSLIQYFLNRSDAL